MAAAHGNRKTERNQRQSAIPVTEPKLEPEVIEAQSRDQVKLPAGVTRKAAHGGYALVGPREALIDSGLAPEAWFAPPGAKNHWRETILANGTRIWTSRTHGKKARVEFHFPGNRSNPLSLERLRKALAEEKKELAEMCGSTDEYHRWICSRVKQASDLIKEIIDEHRGGYQVDGGDCYDIQGVLDELCRKVRYARIEFYESTRQRSILGLKRRTAREDDSLQSFIRENVAAVECGEIVPGAKEGLK